MAQQYPPKLVLGTGTLGVRALTGKNAETFLEDFHKHGGVEIDTAPSYPIYDDVGASERTLAHSGAWARVSTKINTVVPSALSKENIAKSVDKSLQALGGHDIDILYFHLPDPSTPIAESLEAIDKAYHAGKFKRLGISNYSPAQVREILDIVEKNGYVKPAVYQGQYNLLARRNEEELLPLLRNHGISFYAYSPTAAGLLTGKVTRDSANQDGRWSTKGLVGQLYSAAYHHDSMFDAVEKIIAKAREHGIGGHSAALRWALYHSALSKEHGDGVVLGASSVEQNEGNLKACEEGPLPVDLVETIEAAWPNIRDVAPWAWFEGLGVAGRE